MLLRKLFVCWWGGCGMSQRDNATHLWGECTRCGKVAGVISREAVRRYSNAKAAHEQALAKMRAEAATVVREAKARSMPHPKGTET